VRVTVVNTAEGAGEFKLVVEDSDGGPYTTSTGISPGQHQISLEIPKSDMRQASSCTHDVVLQAVTGSGGTREIERITDGIDYTIYFSEDTDLECE